MERDHSKTQFDEQTRRDLARLADGSLEGYRRAELEARLAGSPALRAALERQRTGAAALRGLDLDAPISLRTRLAAQAAAPARHGWRRRRLALGGALAAATAAAALLAVALVAPTGSDSPTVVEAARLADYPPTDAVAADPSNPKVLTASVEGVPFPNWSKEFGWRQDGSRMDPLDGRRAETVFYERGRRRVAYTIVSGEGIAPPADSREVRVNGVRLHSFSEGDRRVVTWWRDGRTCVLSASGVDERTLLTLASWKGDGAVPF
jgi:anti-sigma factor RsiW